VKDLTYCYSLSPYPVVRRIIKRPAEAANIEIDLHKDACIFLFPIYRLIKRELCGAKMEDVSGPAVPSGNPGRRKSLTYAGCQLAETDPEIWSSY
jgi:hypothetical protein